MKTAQRNVLAAGQREHIRPSRSHMSETKKRTNVKSAASHGALGRER